MADLHSPIVILGAGASGLMAAIAASRVRPASVLLLEKEARVGRKLLATGNGRCNLLNTRVDKARYHGSGAHAAHSLLEQMTPAYLKDVFASIGLRCREEAEGRVYPFSGQASSVLDALRFACDSLQVQVKTEATVCRIQRVPSGFLLSLRSGETISASRLIMAGGGKASPSLGADGSAFSLMQAMGHPISPLFPAIAALKLLPERIRGLKGVRADATLSLLCGGKAVHREEGEALFTDYGISGVAAMQMARRVNESAQRREACTLRVSLLDEHEARKEVENRSGLFSQFPMEAFFTGLLHKRMALCLLREAQISPQALAGETDVTPLAALLHAWDLPVLGTLPFAQAQVTAGGALLSSFDPETLASHIVPGLYACGEVLDVDGDCGGYNLMWAWASGLAAGRAAAESLL